MAFKIKSEKGENAVRHPMWVEIGRILRIPSRTGRNKTIGSSFYPHQVPSGTNGNEALSHFAIPRPNVLRSQFVTLKNLPDLKSQIATAKRNVADLILNYNLIGMYFNNSNMDLLIATSWN